MRDGWRGGVGTIKYPTFKIKRKDEETGVERERDRGRKRR